jgi:hypothetical protein
MVHHAIIVSSCSDPLIEQAHREAVAAGCKPSEITPATVNGYRSFFVPPDGSKEGWEASNDGNAARDVLVAWLRSQAYDDGSTLLEWAEVAFHGDGGESNVLRHSLEITQTKRGRIEGPIKMLPVQVRPDGAHRCLEMHDVEQCRGYLGHAGDHVFHGTAWGPG